MASVSVVQSVDNPIRGLCDARVSIRDEMYAHYHALLRGRECVPLEEIFGKLARAEAGMRFDRWILALRDIHQRCLSVAARQGWPLDAGDRVTALFEELKALLRLPFMMEPPPDATAETNPFWTALTDQVEHCRDTAKRVEQLALMADQSADATIEARRTAEDNDVDWMLATEALQELPFIEGGLKGLYRFADESLGKLRMRPHPAHPQRRQVHAADVLKLKRDSEAKLSEALDTPAADSLPGIFESGLTALGERLKAEQARKRKRK